MHRQLADLIREQIRTGRLRPGDLLPAEGRLAAEHGLGRDSVRAALKILRTEGLVTTRAPRGTIVRPEVERSQVRVPRGSQGIVRMPTPEERRALGLDEGVPVVQLTLPSGEVRLLAADRIFLSFS